ncbi:peptidylprolyl isomerase [Citrus sinensis]|nr:peptidylprolyl isomerase [Citrus sinensis]
MACESVMTLEKGANLSDIDGEEEEPGEVIESAAPLKVGEERGLGNSGIKKKLLKNGVDWDTPEFGDEVTIHYVGTLLDGTKFDSTRDRYDPLTFKLGTGQVATGLDNGIITMKKRECAVFTFTLPSELRFGVEGRDSLPPNSVVQFEVELVSWITVVDLSKDGGIVKKILEKGERDASPGDLDEVLVKYQVMLGDGTMVAKTPEEGVEFYLKDGHFCPVLSKAILTMKKGEKVKLVIQPQYAFGEQRRDACDGFGTIPRNSALDFNLELLSFKHVVDVTGDSKVVKKILKEGEGTSADEGATVTISYIARLEDGTVFEKKGYDGEQPLEFITDEEQGIAGLDRVAATMKKEEWAIVTINHEYGFGNVEAKRDLATVPSCAKLYYEVEMMDFIKAADCVSEDGSFVDDEQKLVKSLRVSCWLNSAACCLKLKDYQGAIELCSKVLDCDCHNVKALYRRAQAYMEIADLILAELDIKKAIEADPQNREVTLLQKSLKQLQAESNKRDAKFYANMFAHVTKDSSVATKKLKVEKSEEEKRREVAVAMETEKEVDSSAPPKDGVVVDSC